MIGLSGWRGSVTVIGMRVVSTAAKKISLRGSDMAETDPVPTRALRPVGGVSGVWVMSEGSRP